MTNSEISVIPKTPGEVAKAILYVGLAAVALFQTSNADNKIELHELISIAILVLGLVPVYWFAGTRVKTGIAFGLAGLNALNVLLIGGIGSFGDVSLNDWITIGLQAFAAIGIAVVPNADPVRAAQIEGVYDVSTLASTPDGREYGLTYDDDKPRHLGD